MQHGWDVKFSLSTFWGISVLNFLKLVILGAQGWTSNLPKLLCWVFAMVMRKVFKMFKRGKKCRREREKAHKKDTNWKNLKSYLDSINFSISLLTWHILFLFEKEHCSFLPNVMQHFQNTSSFADNITSTPTSAHDQVSEKLQFDTSVHAVSFCAFHQLLWEIFLCNRNYLHQKCVF